MDNIIEYSYVANIAACIILGIVLIFIKTPPHQHNTRYLKAKRFMALAAFLAAIAASVDLFTGDVNASEVEMLNVITLIDFDVQIIIFTFAMMTLFDSKLVCR